MDRVFGQGILRVYFVGIGGVSMSALALYLHAMGYLVSGYDSSPSIYTDRLIQKGIAVSFHPCPADMQGAQAVILSGAIAANEPHAAYARKHRLPTLTRAQLLGRISRLHSTCIAVSGCHGKTTVTAMLAAILIQAGKSPTVLLGGDAKETGGNLRLGMLPPCRHSRLCGKYTVKKAPSLARLAKSKNTKRALSRSPLVAEACEYQRAFLQLSPTHAVLLNTDHDHPDCYPTAADALAAFGDFLGRVKRGGRVFLSADDTGAEGLARGRAITFGFREGADLRAIPIQPDGEGTADRTPFSDAGKESRASDTSPCETAEKGADGQSFDLFYFGKHLCRINSPLFGLYNVQNACAATAVALSLGIHPSAVKSALEAFTGVARRRERLGTYRGAEVISDYAHHPSEIAATLTAEAGRQKKYAVIFQPHTYTRTSAFLHAFSRALSIAEQVILLPVYAAREPCIEGIYEALVSATAQLTHCIGAGDVASALRLLFAEGERYDRILLLGAGDIDAQGRRATENR
ncbi:MAG: UDP-N-acetylmuramate--L-alanine ligase [Clostridia bacterium]|nr:UDP-N-acetylmuramate--L-alanine ligase [Clostridia bacterium]